MFPICDKFGRVRSDFTDEECAQLDATKADALTVVVAAARRTEIAEENDKAALAMVDDALDALTAAEQGIRDTMPAAPTHVDEVRRMSENSRRNMLGLPPLPNTPFKPEKKLVAALGKAEKDLSAARQRAAQTMVELKAARSVLGDALTNWGTLTAVKTEDMIRDHLRRQNEHARKIAAGEIAAPPPAVEHTPSHLDASMSAGKSRGANSVNRGHGRNFAKRGLTVRR